MNSLQQYGIQPSGVKTFLLHNEENKLGPDEYFNKSTGLLKKLQAVVEEEIIPKLETYPATWHPSGFLTYPLGTHKDLGTLRFHVWPAGLRRRVVKGRGRLGDIYDGDIHNHAWYIASISLAYYSDNFYQVKLMGDKVSDEELSADTTLFRIFNVTYGENAHQALTTDGRYVKAEVERSRVANRGDVHIIDPSKYHAPTVPDDRLGATLVFSSFRVDSTGTDVLIGGSTEPIVGSRHEATPEDSLLAKKQLLSQ